MPTDTTSTDGGQKSRWAQAGELLRRKQNQAGVTMRLTSEKTAIVNCGGDLHLYRFCRKGRDRRPDWHLEGRQAASGKLLFRSRRAQSNYQLAMPQVDPADFDLFDAAFRRHVTDTREFRRSAKQKELEFRLGHFDRGADWIRQHSDFSESECLFFPGAVIHRPHRVKWNYQEISAARLMLTMTQGLPEFEDSVARHKCGMGHMSCVNPLHLCWGSSGDNAKDRLLHSDQFADPSEVPAEVASLIKSDPRLVKVIAVDFGVQSSAVSSLKLSK